MILSSHFQSYNTPIYLNRSVIPEIERQDGLSNTDLKWLFHFTHVQYLCNIATTLSATCCFFHILSSGLSLFKLSLTPSRMSPRPHLFMGCHSAQHTDSTSPSAVRDLVQQVRVYSVLHLPSLPGQ